MTKINKSTVFVFTTVLMIVFSNCALTDKQYHAIRSVYKSAKTSYDEYSGEYERGLFFGASVGKPVFIDDNGAYIEDAIDFNFQAGGDINKYFSAAFELGFILCDAQLKNNMGKEETGFVDIGFILKYKPFYRRVSPYIVAGLGVGAAGSPDPNSYINMDPSFHFESGLGVEVNASQRNTFALEAIYHYFHNSGNAFHPVNFNLVYRFTF